MPRPPRNKVFPPKRPPPKTSKCIGCDQLHTGPLAICDACQAASEPFTIAREPGDPERGEGRRWRQV